MSNANAENIKSKFEGVYFLEYDNGDSLETIQVKAEKRVWMFDRWSPYPAPLSWKEAEEKFLSMLTEQEKKAVSFSYDSEEYADVEEHDEERECRTLTLKINLELLTSEL